MGVIVPFIHVNQLMFRHIHNGPALSSLLCGLLFLAMWSNLLAYALCPHRSSTSNPCFKQDLLLLSHDVPHEHHTGMQMSDMDMQDMPMETSATELGDAESSELTRSDALTTEIRDFKGFDPIIAGAITRPNESCSHCLMHSQTPANSPLPVSLVNNSTLQILPAAAIVVATQVSSPLTFVDLHDHGPPGLNSPRYVLNSAFRI
jgi:hypothetical protein